jgi:hypothetical protein
MTNAKSRLEMTKENGKNVEDYVTGQMHMA